MGDKVGRIDVGLEADLALWHGALLEVTSLAEAVWTHGVSMPMRSRQTQLRDRYLPAPDMPPRAYSRCSFWATLHSTTATEPEWNPDHGNPILPAPPRPDEGARQ